MVLAFGELVRPQRLRDAAKALGDGSTWPVGLVLGVWARHDFDAAAVHARAVLALSLLAVVLQWAVGIVLSLYRGRYTYGSFDEVLGVSLTAAIVAAALFLLVAGFQSIFVVPRGAPAIAALIALLLMVGLRYVLRLCLERSRRPGPEAQRVLVFGAGEAGAQLVRQMLREPAGHYLPVGFLDDDPAKRHLRIAGVPVLGTRDAMRAAAARAGVSTLIVALPSADAALIREVDALASGCHLPVKIVPTLDQLIDGRVHLGDLRDVDVIDLIGRHPIDTDVQSIAGYLTGKRVLVTGAGGSIGSELCRQIAKFGPAELLMLDRDESGLHAVQLSIYGRALLDSPDVVLADIRDARSMVRLLRARRPQVVFHAAALKHLPMLEQYPAEAYKTNVLGTLNVLRAAAHVDVDVFVNISTDKAANPCSVLGHSKRVAERLTSFMGEQARGTFLSVRFGNVLGSRGSVLHTFHAQIASGGPVTVTHPHVTRYFMTIPEACQLVIQAAAIGRNGEALVLDMGQPVRISDVAQRLIRQSGKRVDIVYTGLREGEKLHEQLFAVDERDHRPLHPKISHVRVPVIDPAELSMESWYETSPAPALVGQHSEGPLRALG